MAAEIKELFEGKWTSYKMENGDEILQALGAGFLRRKLASAFHPSLTITVDGDSITITMSMGPKTNKETFKLGEEYECRPPPNETPSKAVATWSEGKMKVTVTPNDSNGKVQHIEREIVNGELIQMWKTKMEERKQRIQETRINRDK